MKAIILAAGRGTRLKPLTDTVPKCLIEIGGKTLLEHSLDALKQNGINEAVIVIGYLGNLVKEKIGTTYNGLNMKYVENKEYSTTGHAYSLYLTKGLIHDSTLIIEGDLLYEPDVIKVLLEHPQKDVILTTELSGSGDEIYMYTDEDDNLSNIKRNLEGTFTIKQEISDQDRLIGELVGLSKFSKEFLDKLYKEIEKAYIKGNRNQYYEEALFLASKSMPIKCFLKKQLIWTEIDDERDLNKAKNIIFPKLMLKKKIFVR